MGWCSLVPARTTASSPSTRPPVASSGRSRPTAGFSAPHRARGSRLLLDHRGPHLRSRCRNRRQALAVPRRPVQPDRRVRGASAPNRQGPSLRTRTLAAGGADNPGVAVAVQAPVARSRPSLRSQRLAVVASEWNGRAPDSDLVGDRLSQFVQWDGVVRQPRLNHGARSSRGDGTRFGFD